MRILCTLCSFILFVGSQQLTAEKIKERNICVPLLAHYLESFNFAVDATKSELNILYRVGGEIARPYIGLKAELRSGRLEFYINTQAPGGAGYASPKIKAKELFEMMMSYFDDPISEIQARWFPIPSLGTSKNLEKYRDGVALHGNKIRAARETWTGKLAEKYGYTKVTDIADYNSGVMILFQKP